MVVVKSLVPLFASLSPPASKSFTILSLTKTLRPTASPRITAISAAAIARASSTASHSNSRMNTEKFVFGPYKIDPKEVFYSTDLSFAMVNLRPVVPAQKIGSRLESYHKASSLTLTIQDGPQAGQTVPHVHIHILPRKSGDFENNDEIYDAIDVKEKELKEKLDLDKERKDRSFEEMTAEADEYRKFLA